MIVRDVLDAAARSIRKRAGDATPWDARLLLAHSIGHGRPLALEPREELPVDAASRFEALWEKRLAGRPVQHLVGEWDFFGRPFFVDGRALVPRPETEILIEAALAEAPEARRVLDLGTGSGILAATWLLERPDSRAVAVDVSTDALALARANGSRHSILPRLGLVAGDWTSALSSRKSFDLAISNPPYAPSKVGLLPSCFMPSRWTMKNGILVPSFDVASICSTTSPVASNIAGSRLISDTPPFSAVTYSVVGWMKLVKVKK